jgi:hypothetical protein
MTALLNLLPVLLAIVCYILSGVFKADPSTHDGLNVLAGVLAGMAIPRLGDMFRRSQAEQPTAKEATVTSIRPKDGQTGRVSLGLLRDALILAALVGLLSVVFLYALTAKADTGPQLGVRSGIWSVQPSAAVGWVANLKTGEVVSAATLLGVSGCRNGPIALCAGLYGGSVLSPSGARPTLAVLFSVANFGAIGPGVVMFRDGGTVIYQATLNLSLNLNFGGSPAYVQGVAARTP